MLTVVVCEGSKVRGKTSGSWSPGWPMSRRPSWCGHTAARGRDKGMTLDASLFGSSDEGGFLANGHTEKVPRSSNDSITVQSPRIYSCCNRDSHSRSD